MARIQPTIAVWDCDRTRPLLDGRIAIEGCDPLWFSDMPIETMFSRAFAHAEFDVSELSFSNFLARIDGGDSAYVGLPVFPSRSFRHGAWFVHAESGIREPKDLCGRRLGVREYSMTAAVAARGVLSDEYGIRADDIAWVVGDVDDHERSIIPLPDLPEGFSVSAAPSGVLLSDMLLRGELDGLLAYKPPRAFLAGNPAVRRLFPDYAEREKDYARRTGVFPLMHLMGLKRGLAQEHPWLARSLLLAFTAAKDQALADLSMVQALKIALPWSAQALEETREILGTDYWPYGIKDNLKAVEALARWHHEQGLSRRLLTVKDMLAATVLDS